jgi:hypothetical protein
VATLPGKALRASGPGYVVLDGRPTLREENAHGNEHARKYQWGQRPGARWRRALAALVSGLTVGGALVAMAAPAVARPVEPARAPLAPLAGYVRTGTLGGPSYVNGAKGVVENEALSTAQTKDVGAVREAAAQLVAATREAVAAKARFSADAAACGGRHGVKACYEEQGRMEVLETSVDLREMGQAGASWSAAELRYRDAAQTLERALGRKPGFSATAREPAPSTGEGATAKKDTLAVVSAFRQEVKAAAGYRAALAQQSKLEATCSNDPSAEQCWSPCRVPGGTEAGRVVWHQASELADGDRRGGKGAVVAALVEPGPLYCQGDPRVSAAASSLQRAERNYYDADQVLATVLGVHEPPPRATAQGSGFSLWGGIFAAAVCMATLPLDATGAGEVIDAAAIGEVVASADTEAVASAAAVVADTAEEAAGSLSIVGSPGETEVAVGRLLADQGREVVVLEEDSSAGRMADLLVDGTPYDVYTPEAGTSVRSVLTAAARKFTQVGDGGGIVINLQDSDLSASDFGDNALARVNGFIRSWGYGDSNL